MHMHGPWHGMEKRVTIQPPAIGVFFFTMFIMGAMVRTMVSKKVAKSLDTIAILKALDKMPDKFSETERADLEARVRTNLLTTGHGCCK